MLVSVALVGTLLAVSLSEGPSGAAGSPGDRAVAPAASPRPLTGADPPLSIGPPVPTVVGQVELLNGSGPGPGPRINQSVDPVQAVYDPSLGRIFVLNAETESLAVVSNQTHAIVQTVSVGGFVAKEVYDSGTGQIFVSNPGAGGVDVFAASTGKLTTFIGLEANTEGLVYAPAANEVFVSLPGVGTVAAISDVSDKVVHEWPVGSDPEGLAYDAATGDVYVAICGSGFVSAISVSTASVVGSTAVPSCPIVVAADPTDGDVFVAEEYGDDLVSLNASTLAPVGSILVPPGAQGLTYDNGTGDFLYSSGLTNNLTIVSPAAGMVVASVPLGAPAGSTAYDPADHEALVPLPQADTLLFVADSSDSIVGATVLGGAPESLAYDPLENAVYVASYTSGTVSVISASTNAVTATVRVGARPIAVAVDPVSGDVYVSNYGSSDVSVIDGSSNSVLATVATGPCTNSLAFDAALDSVVVAESCFGRVALISAQTNEVTATLRLGEGNAAVTYDSSNGEAYVAESEDDGFTNLLGISGSTGDVVSNLTLEPGSPVSAVYDSGTGEVAIEVAGSYEDELVEVSPSTDSIVQLSDLPYGQKMIYDPAESQIVLAAPGASAVDVVPDGSSVEYLGPYVPGTPWAGTLDTANGRLYFALASTDEVAYFGYPATYPVAFVETGSLDGQSWTVQLGGTVAEGFGTPSTVVFSAANGSYPYIVEGSPGWILSGLPPTGTLQVQGQGITEEVHFVPGVTANLQFRAQGLGAGATWCVGFFHPRCSAGPGRITIDGLVPGSYPYNVTAAGGFVINATFLKVTQPAGGSLSLSSGSNVVRLTFRFHYVVEFGELGLPSGTAWSVRLRHTTDTTVGPPITFFLQNGTYRFAIGSEPGYTHHASASVARVQGDAVVIIIEFVKRGS